MTISGDANRWEVAVAQGIKGEKLAIPIMSTFLGFQVIHANETNVRAVDLDANVSIDIKILRSPFNRTPTSAGLEASKHVTLDYANLVKYAPTTWIWCVIDYTQHPKNPQDVKGIFHITAGRVMEIVKEHPERVYTRPARTRMDKEKKIGISTDEMGQITFPGLNRRESADLFLQ